jgi:2-polyprenyl-6-methoxyphenol hydroxylase-like FAD-dependent oxidoreductase
MPHSTQTPKIAIVGAGPVSLTLANILENNHISFTIFESSDKIRTAGGSLDLHPESGQLALKEAGLWKAFVENSRPESDCDKIVSHDGEILWDENLLVRNNKASMEDEQFAGRPEIDRKLLLKILSDNLPHDKIQFGKKLDHVEPSTTQEAKYDLHFADGSQETDFDLVIGADGAWSHVRRLLSDTKPQYSGISMIEVNCEDIKSNPWLLDFVGAGSMFSFGEGCAVMAQRQGDGALRTYAGLRVAEDFLDTCGIDWSKAETAREEYVKRFFSHLADDLKRVILDCKDSLRLWPLYELPVGFRWQGRSGVTLVGDAAHVMTPFAGVGVNVGMTDSLVLAKEIIAVSKGEKSLDDAVQAYEKEMFPRAQANAEKTAWGKKNHFSAGGAKMFADMMRGHHQPQETAV